MSKQARRRAYESLLKRTIERYKEDRETVRNVRLPRTFYETFYLPEDYSVGNITRKSKRYVWVDITESELAALSTDARYHAEIATEMYMRVEELRLR